MSTGKTCATADGKDVGKPCGLDGKCDATQGLSCNSSTGNCDFSSPGGYNDPCLVDSNCTKYPGLKCKPNDSGAGNHCDCTDASTIAAQCDSDKICVSGGSPPPPPPPTSQWPTNYTPAPSPDWVTKNFTGSCANSSDWYKSSGPLCIKGNLGLQDKNNANLCMDLSTYQTTGQAFSGSYQKACFIDA